jgi:hypothetical protein
VWCGCDFGRKSSPLATAATAPAGVVSLLRVSLWSPPHLPGLRVKPLTASLVPLPSWGRCREANVTLSHNSSSYAGKFRSYLKALRCQCGVVPARGQVVHSGDGLVISQGGFSVTSNQYWRVLLVGCSYSCFFPFIFALLFVRGFPRYFVSVQLCGFIYKTGRKYVSKRNRHCTPSIEILVLG